MVVSILTALFVAAETHDKIYGVSLGSWLVLESWMLPAEWLAMGGQSCSVCSDCIATELQDFCAYPNTADQAFAAHWSTWFTQDNVNELKAASINTVRIPLGFWIVEGLVDRSAEFYPRGGIKFLARGLKWLHDAGIQVILDHHALPGVAAVNQMFAGNCTTDPQFYTPHNYHRALIWTAVMASLTHLHPNFASVFAIEAVNEPISDAAMTPGFGDFQHNFVKTIRAVELILGVPIANTQPVNLGPSNTSGMNVSTAIPLAAKYDTSGIFTPEIVSVLKDAVPMLLGIGNELGMDADILVLGDCERFGGRWSAIVTTFMDVNWQTDNPPNPADAAIGPQGYDNHLYYNYGGVADPNPDAYLTSICNLNRVQADAALGNSPLWFGEWAITTQFDNATDEFLRMWADAQKLAYSKGAGWIFWNFKVEISELAGDLARQWSYLEGVKRGYFTKDPAQLHNPHVCDPYINSTSTNATRRWL
ncbi:glycoside hydrolase family 5 protein [Stereum hirsutum FP-91666 SS1]|uniref:glycoside hydrolase family 5 protein n=1 Tax=Stereum hirsutum (strain FP-91666) TaxID=721885 RepID=UPI000440BDC2|nr:glycoside hydrolase family 5 protein [Stereum hirsutum FP-91666 SS1]EIM86923.1 glycoside hydrolase family 5 protein [Stereum hirsutum FP-91666 SS1]